jgi:hypothetical protein
MARICPHCGLNSNEVRTICYECNAEFMTAYKSKIYCSNKCKVKAFKKKKAKGKTPLK